MASSGMLRRVAIVRTDVSEERIASIISVKRISEQEKTLALTSNCSTLRRNIQYMRKEAIADSSPPDNGDDIFFRNIGSYKWRRRNIPGDGILHSYRRENLKAYI
jgi:hypothetical protein